MHKLVFKNEEYIEYKQLLQNSQNKGPSFFQLYLNPQHKMKMKTIYCTLLNKESMTQIKQQVYAMYRSQQFNNQRKMSLYECTNFCEDYYTLYLKYQYKKRRMYMNLLGTFFFGLIDVGCMLLLYKLIKQTYFLICDQNQETQLNESQNQLPYQNLSQILQNQTRVSQTWSEYILGMGLNVLKFLGCGVGIIWSIAGIKQCSLLFLYCFSNLITLKKRLNQLNQQIIQKRNS